MIEARIPSMEWKAGPERRAGPLSVCGFGYWVDDVCRLRRLGPDHLPAEFAVGLLPLRQHHLMRELQTMMGRVGGELDVAEEGGDVGRVERLGHFLRIERAGLLDGLLEDHATGVTR